MRCVTKVLLRDLRPPWVDHHFPQAVPGEYTLSVFTRPSFLQWGAADAEVLFGARLFGKIKWAADRVDLDFAGVIARPLYKCTEILDDRTGAVCGNVASMSRFLQNTEARGRYRQVQEVR